MNRDIVCRCRLLIDSFPARIRNSRILFNLLALILRENEFLFEFRELYEKNPDFDLTLLYNPESRYFSNAFSNKTDCNSKHQKLIASYLSRAHPYSLLDVGCGSGFLLTRLREKVFIPKLTGVDINTSSNNPLPSEVGSLTLINSEILEYLSSLPDNHFDVILCTHVLEHLKDPSLLVAEIRRVSSRASIFVAPLEKKLKWGLNYHVNFYETPIQFLNLFTVSPKQLTLNISYVELGDILYIEEYIQ